MADSDPVSPSNLAALDHAASSDLRWLAAVLWGGLEGVRVVRGDAPSARERYVVLPTAARARMVLPADGRAIAAALRDGNALRSPRTRAARSAAAWAARVGDTAIFRDRLAVIAADADAAARLPSAVLGRVLGRDVTLGVNVRPPGPYRKPVAQVLDLRSGEVVAYAKLAWSPLTDRNVVAEAGALASIARSRGPLRAPVLRAREEFRGHALVVTEPMPLSLRPWPRARGAPPVAVTHQVATAFGTAVEPFGASACRDALGAAVASASPSAPRSASLSAPLQENVDPAFPTALARALEDLVEALVEVHGDTDLPFAGWHGDWSPWNLGIAEGRVWAWDWEYARGDVPLGIDVLHYHFQCAFILERLPFEASFAKARAAGVSALRELGLDTEQSRAAAGIHAALVGARYLDAAVAGATPNPRVVSEGAPALRALAAATRG